MNNAELLQALFDNFVNEGGDPKVTTFKPFLSDLINEVIKPNLSSSGLQASGDWRNEVKAMFGGTGRKWATLPNDLVLQALEGVEGTETYVSHIERNGSAHVRFASPIIVDNSPGISFEIRYIDYKTPSRTRVNVSVEDFESLGTQLSGTAATLEVVPKAFTLENILELDVTQPVEQEVVEEEVEVLLTEEEDDENDETPEAEPGSYMSVDEAFAALEEV